jgi:hypothetical protein
VAEEEENKKQKAALKRTRSVIQPSESSPLKGEVEVQSGGSDADPDDVVKLEEDEELNTLERRVSFHPVPTIHELD